MSQRSHPVSRSTAKRKSPPKRENIFSKYLPLWVFGGAFIVIAVILIVVFTAPSKKTDPLDKSMGPATAKVVITEYGDFQCPACKNFAAEIEPKLKADFVDKGLVRMQFRQMAFIGDESMLASQAAECANEQGKFWEYYSKLYENQGGENTGVFNKDSLAGWAKDLNLDVNKFNSCLSSNKYKTKVETETNEGQNKGVYQTPSVLINDKLVTWNDYTELQGLINTAIQSNK